MRFSDNIAMALRDLKRRKGRTFLTSLGIAIGTLLILIMVGLGLSMKQFLVKSMSTGSDAKNLTVHNMSTKAEGVDMQEVMEDPEEYFKKIDDEAINKIKDIDGVKEVKASINSFVEKIKVNGEEKKVHMMVDGYNLNGSVFFEDEVESKKVSEGDTELKPLVRGEMLSKDSKGDALITEQLLEDLKLENNDSIIGKEITIVVDKANGMNIKPIEQSFKIKGIINKKMMGGQAMITSSDDSAKIQSYSTLVKDYKDEKGYNSVKITAKSPDNVDSVEGKVKDLGYKVQSNKGQIEEMQKALNIISIILAILGIIVLFVSSLGIVNTMVMAIYERTRSIGVMKSVGANGNVIRNMFLVQSGMIGFIGGLIGILVSYAAFGGIRLALEAYLKKENAGVTVELGMPLWLVFTTLAFSIVIAVLAGIYPARRASKMNPIDALNE